MYHENTPNRVRRLLEARYRTGVIGKLHINPESAFPFDMKKIPSSNFSRKTLADCQLGGSVLLPILGWTDAERLFELLGELVDVGIADFFGDFTRA